MLRQTFVHVPGIGFHTERSLWQQGCADWDCFLSSPRSFSVGSAGKATACRELERSRNALEFGEHQYFRKRLRQRAAWRAFPEFRHSCVYLDIETDGRADGDNVTVICLFDGKTYRAFTKGEDLESFRDAISHYSMIVTFFGTGFDLPVLERRFPGLMLDQIHLDLCPALRQVGFSGGLKRIEKDLGIERSPETAGLNGYDAVKLWRAHTRGNHSAYETLIQYNREDVVNLEPIAELLYEKSKALALASRA